jgi:hypothetical protein
MMAQAARRYQWQLRRQAQRWSGGEEEDVEAESDPQTGTRSPAKGIAGDGGAGDVIVSLPSPDGSLVAEQVEADWAAFHERQQRTKANWEQRRLEANATARQQEEEVCTFKPHTSARLAKSRTCTRSSKQNGQTRTRGEVEALLKTKEAEHAALQALQALQEQMRPNEAMP